MKMKWILYIGILLRSKVQGPTTPKVEKIHDPWYYRKHPSPYINGTDYQIPGAHITPDYREPEPPFLPLKDTFYKEENRPYRMSPAFIQGFRWNEGTKKSNNAELMGCYCCTVYKRLTPLAGCAVITTRHILTTATSTELVLKKHRAPNKNVAHILGAWYDHNANVWNSSMYMTPARIHYHPRYIRPENLNVSHPIVGYYDLSVWAATYPFYGNFWSYSKAVICNRGGSHQYSAGSPTAWSGELFFIVGFQFIIAFKKVPMPFFKYAVRTRDTVNPCPKTEWGWYQCIPAQWAKFGIEPGAALHRCYEGTSWRYDGMIGMCQFSMRLRHNDLIHYFHPVDTHRVLDFLYSAYNGRLPYAYLDYRFYDTQWRAPIPKPWFYIPWDYHFGYVGAYNHVPFNY